MTEQELLTQQDKILKGVQEAVAQAIERHRRLGQSIAVIRDDQVVILTPEEIEPLVADRNAESEARLN
jgi:20S proteasome alpha/beta subunit